MRRTGSNVRRYLIVLTTCAAALTSAGLIQPIQADADSSGGSYNVIETSSTGIWAGGIVRMANGRYYFVYMRGGGPGVPGKVYGRKMATPLSTPGAAHHLIGNNSKGYLDPGVTRTATGGYLLTMHSGAAGINTVGLNPTRGTLTTRITNITGHGYNEAAVGRYFGKVRVTYNAVQDGDYSRRVLVRTLYSATRASSSTSHLCCSGLGPAGSQDRATIARTGAPDSLILVWSRPTDPGGGNRSIFGAISTDAGSKWGAPFRIAADPTSDLMNPFVIRVGSELRVYAEAKTPAGRRLEVATSPDDGLTWGPLAVVPIDPAINGIGRPVFIVADGQVVCFASWQTKEGIWVLGTFVVPPA